MLFILFVIVRGIFKLWPLWLGLLTLIVIALAVDERKKNEEADLRAAKERREREEYEKKRDAIMTWKKQWPREKEILSAEWTKKQCSTIETYNRGWEMYWLHFVKRIFVDGMHFSGRVSSSSNNRTYLCEALFDESGNLLEQHCDCPAFSKYPGACKHLVAMYCELGMIRVLINMNQLQSARYKTLELGTMIDNYYLRKTTEEGNTISLVGRITWLASDYFELKEVHQTTIRAYSMRCYWYSNKVRDYARRNQGKSVKVYGIVRGIATYKIIECSLDVIKIETE